MSEQVTFTINGREVTADKGEWLLDVIRREGFEVPSLCHHPAVKPYGACRICLVEITKNGWPKITTSCNYPVIEGLEAVVTDNEEIHKNRKLVLELLLARSPEAPKLQQMAKKMGLGKPRYVETEFTTDNCILCGLCARVCEEVVGVDALGFSMRGGLKAMSAPFNEEPENCIACGACVYVCPTNCVGLVQMVEKKKILRWDRELEMQICEVCGYPFAPKFQLEYFKKLADLPDDFYNKCTNCR